MWKNYFKIAWRNIRRNAVNSIQNILGLAIAFVICLFSVLYLLDETSYDKFHENADRIYRVNTDIKINDYERHSAKSNDVIGPLLKESFPEVESYCRFFELNEPFLVRHGEEYLRENNATYSDASLFEIFDIPIVKASGSGLLEQPNTVIITESIAHKYFGDQEAVGNSLDINHDSGNIDDRRSYTVVAVIADFRPNSHFGFDFIFPMSDLAYGWNNYAGNNFNTYLLLKNGVDQRALTQQIEHIVEKRLYEPLIQQLGFQTSAWDTFNQAGNQLTYSLFPMVDIHLLSDRSGELRSNGNLGIIYILSLLVFFVLVVACVNFTNLFTARAAARLREIGIRKTMGSTKWPLILQFFVEALALVGIAMIISLFIAVGTLSYFSEVTLKSFEIANIFQLKIIVFAVCMVVFVALLAGSYPAFYLSSIRSSEALRGRNKEGDIRNDVTKTLMILQFAIATVFIIGTIVIYSQLKHIQDQDVGYVKEQVLAIDNLEYLGKNAQSFKNGVSKIPGVLSGSIASSLPVNASELLGYFSHGPNTEESQSFQGRNWFVDEGFVETMGMTMLEGRGFSTQHGSDYRSVIINEEAAKQLGLENPVGQKIYTEVAEYDIVGLIQDFNYESLREQIDPVILNFNDGTGEVAAFRVSVHADIQSVIAEMNEVWDEMAPHYPMDFYFMDDAFDRMYRTEQVMGRIGLTVSLCAILIACIGLLGLVSHTVERRVKEIGVRKVLGASVAAIAFLLSKDFIKLIGIAILIASPIAWYLMNRWLADFAYRIDIEWWMFAIAGLVAVVIALLTVSFQAVRAAVANPVESLRSE